MTKLALGIMALFVAGSAIYYLYDYLSNRPIEVTGQTCVYPAIAKARSQQDVDLLVKENEVRFATKSGTASLPNVAAQEQMLIAEFMSCQHEKRNPNLTEDQKLCYRAFILNTMHPDRYDPCRKGESISRHLGQLRSLSTLLAKTPSAKMSLDLDSKSADFETQEITAPTDEELIIKICNIYKEKLSCVRDGSVMRIKTTP